MHTSSRTEARRCMKRKKEKERERERERENPSIRIECVCVCVCWAVRKREEGCVTTSISFCLAAVFAELSQLMRAAPSPPPRARVALTTVEGCCGGCRVLNYVRDTQLYPPTHTVLADRLPSNESFDI